MKIKAFTSRYEMTLGETPSVLIDPAFAEEWYGRDPFEETVGQGVSENLVMDPNGTTDGHNVMRDSTFTDSMLLDKYVPVSPLFVKDLAGRVVYIGYGPERKGNSEWMAYEVDQATLKEDEVNPFVPLCVFPRFCRDVEGMDGAKLLEQVFLTKFRCLEMSMGFNGMLSGMTEEDSLVSASYLSANLYPYKLRLDTYYIDGWKLPQTQMVYARGDNMNVNPVAAKRLGDEMLAGWQERAAGTSYTDWHDAMGDAAFEKLYRSGCTLIPTFEACNGFHVVGPEFELEDYWPGRAVLGLHDIVERRGDKAPQGTILDVVEPGYVTATLVRPAKVIVSDGSGYVSPNATDPLPLVPNLHLPHQRVIDDWRATWLPTHPEHFEAPALWGWELDMGRFMQLSGPLWDPLHYYYESVDKVLAAFDASPLSEKRPLVPVPEEMEHRFYPVVPMTGFDTFSQAEFKRRADKKVKPLSSIKRVPTEDYTAGLGYHPLPAEFEFELDTFWFPEMHPVNRDHGVAPVDVSERIAPIINPQVTVSMFKPTLDVPEMATWFGDETKLFTPVDDPLQNYPDLTRYLVPDMALEAVMKLCPVPFLSDPGELLGRPAPGWWLTEEGEQLDGPMALQELIPNINDALWDMRQEGVRVVQFRHTVYRTQLPLYMLAWWNGWNITQLAAAFTDWIKPETEETDAA